MNQFGKILLTGTFLIFIFLIGAYQMITVDKETSNTENRTLAQKPDITIDSIKSGKYMEDFEAYFTDQFPSRDRWLGFYVDYQLFTNQSKVNDLYVLNDNWIMPIPNNQMNKQELNESTSSVNDFAAYLGEKEIEFYYFVLPHKSTILQFLYPNYVEEGKDRELLEYFLSEINEEAVTAVDMLNVFENRFTKEELKQMYFKTDHHWNINGAFEGYKIMFETFEDNSNYFNGDALDLNTDSYTKRCISPSKTFQGSFNRQLYMRVQSDDDLDMCTMIREDMFSDYDVYLGEEEIEPFDLYAAGLNSNSNSFTYGNIFSYDHKEINIINNTRKDAGNVLVIKNSYTNPIIYHIAQNFYRTTIYDPRHNDDRTIKEYIDNNDFNVVVVMYNNRILSGSNFVFDSK